MSEGEHTIISRIARERLNQIASRKLTVAIVGHPSLARSLDRAHRQPSPGRQMMNPFVLEAILHWVAVGFYIVATVLFALISFFALREFIALTLAD